MVFNFFSNITFSIYLVYAVRELGLGAGTIALGASSSMALILVPLAPQSQPIPFLLAAQIVMTFGVVVYNITAISFQQEITPDRMLGRLNASRRFLVWGVIPLGALIGGTLATVIGLRPTLFVGAIGIAFAALPILFSPLRSLGPRQSPASASASSAQA